MGRFKKVTAKTPEGAASEGLSSIAAFFKPVPRPAPVNKGGRPVRKSRRKAAPTVPPFIGPQPPTAAQMTAAATAAPGLSKLASAAAAAVAGVPLDAAEKAAVLKASRKEGHGKPTRTNWSKGANLQKMTAACDAWKNQTAPFVTGMAMSAFAKVVQIPEKTLTPYLKGTKTVGKGQGAPSLLGDDHESFVCDVICRQDRGQDGLTVAGVQNLVQTIAPHLRAGQVSNLAKNVRKRNSVGGSGPLTGPVKAQSTSTARMKTTFAQQARWDMVSCAGAPPHRGTHRSPVPSRRDPNPAMYTLVNHRSWTAASPFCGKGTPGCPSAARPSVSWLTSACSSGTRWDFRPPTLAT